MNTVASFELMARQMLEKALTLRSNGRPLSSPEIENSVAQICGYARGRGIQAERLIIDLKQAWYSVAEPATHAKGEIIARLVTMCILEYYRDGQNDGKMR